MRRRFVRYSMVILALVFAAIAWVALQRIQTIAADTAHIRELSWIVIAALAVGFAASMIVFTGLGKRLQQLALRVSAITAPDKDEKNAEASPPLQAHDELDIIEQSFLRLRRQATDLETQLRGVDAQRRELLANISHDLRTPLASIRGYLETLILKQGTLSEDQQRHYLEVAEKQCGRLEKLISDLFDLTKLESDSAKITPEVFPVTELVQDVAQKFGLAAHQKDILIETNYGSGIPAVLADIGLIERALENLIGNALRHCEPGGKILIALETMGERVVLKVADTGVGIAPEHLPRVFDRFYQADRNYGSNSGAGLGLAITRRIAALHGSDIRVESVKGEGSTFCFDLPAAQ